MIEASWDADGIRLRGVPAGTGVQVRPHADIADLPSTAGRLIPDGDELRFVPRFDFVDGTTYVVRAGGVVVATLSRPRPERPSTAEVVAVYPTAVEVPRNLLRCYVQFSAPMARGYADRVRLVDDAGNTIDGALLPTDHELWDADRVRLTVLLDPARIKRGLAGGAALRSGTLFRLVVDPGFLDAQGIPLRRRAEQRYRVSGDERRRVDPTAWTMSTPPDGSLLVEFDRPLDRGLLDRCLQVIGPDGRAVEGVGTIGSGERSWRLTPARPWSSATYHLVVNSVLEDLAGNSVARVFDRDLSRSEDAPGTSEPVTVAFHPG